MKKLNLKKKKDFSGKVFNLFLNLDHYSDVLYIVITDKILKKWKKKSGRIFFQNTNQMAAEPNWIKAGPRIMMWNSGMSRINPYRDKSLLTAIVQNSSLHYPLTDELGL